MIDISPEALKQVRENAAYGDPWDDDFVLALIDALEEARAALREAQEFIGEELVRPEHEPAIPGSFADEATRLLTTIRKALG